MSKSIRFWQKQNGWGKRLQGFLVLSLVLSIPFMLFHPYPVFAQEAVSVAVDPVSYVLLNTCSDTFSVIIDGVSDLYGFDIRLSFDPALLQVVDANGLAAGIQIHQGDFLEKGFTFKNTVDNSAGTLWFAATQLKPQLSKNGSGALIEVQFAGIQNGSSAITITHAQLVRNDGTEISAAIQDGQVQVADLGSGESCPITATPTSSITATSTPSKTATVTKLPPTAVPPTQTLAPTQTPSSRPTFATPTAIVTPAIPFTPTRKAGLSFTSTPQAGEPIAVMPVSVGADIAAGDLPNATSPVPCNCSETPPLTLSTAWSDISLLVRSYFYLCPLSLLPLLGILWMISQKKQKKQEEK